MSASEIVLKKIKTLLTDAVEVDDLTIPYFTDYFGSKQYGIYLSSESMDDDSNKHTFSEVHTLELEVFGIGKSKAFVMEATRKVRDILKASVGSTLQLSGGYQATYTQITSVFSSIEMDNNTTTHRYTIRLVIRVDEISN
jgi:hypothetical protein